MRSLTHISQQLTLLCTHVQMYREHWLGWEMLGKLAYHCYRPKQPNQPKGKYNYTYMHKANQSSTDRCFPVMHTAHVPVGSLSVTK